MVEQGEFSAYVYADSPAALLDPRFCRVAFCPPNGKGALARLPAHGRFKANYVCFLRHDLAVKTLIIASPTLKKISPFAKIKSEMLLKPPKESFAGRIVWRASLL